MGLSESLAAVSQEVSDEVVGEGFDEILLLGIAGQVAQWRHRHGDIRQQARPGQPGCSRAWQLVAR
jgi:hypothetical protein